MMFTPEKKIFIFDLANNHMGNLEHGLQIIRELKQVVSDFDYTFAFKLQYRHLDTFIHPDYRDRFEYKYVKRFSETRLAEDDLKRLKDEAQALGFITICTPFDEPSVDLIESHDFDIIKVASCSFTDWPLLERIVKTNRPIIASTAGATLDDIDRVVSFFQHRHKEFALMHCVAEYPTREENLQLNQIDLLKQRYPEVPVGFSTHEDPEETDAIKIAIAKGASIFERHVGIVTEKFKLNQYSSTPGQIKHWLEAAVKADRLCGEKNQRYSPSQGEIQALKGLRRGVFAKKEIKKGDSIDLQNVFFAIPLQEDQLTANDIAKYIEYRASHAINLNSPVKYNDVTITDHRKNLYEIIQDVKKLIHKSGVTVPGQSDLEISHHYGLDQFRQYGLTIITVVNRDYCKKLLILLPGQFHPEQYHVQKEETFHILYGDLTVILNGKEKKCSVGDVIIIEPGVKHAFRSDTGAIIEEISSTHYADDSYYTDPVINKNKNRKTFITYWLD